MSNRAVVIVMWSGTDQECSNTKAEIDERLSEIDARYRKEMGTALSPWVVGYPIMDEGEHPPGYACEVAAIAHENHFSRGALLDALRSLEWDEPEAVAFVWRNEYTTTPELVRMEEAQ